MITVAVATILFPTLLVHTTTNTVNLDEAVTKLNAEVSATAEEVRRRLHNKLLHNGQPAPVASTSTETDLNDVLIREAIQQLSQQTGARIEVRTVTGELVASSHDDTLVDSMNPDLPSVQIPTNATAPNMHAWRGAYWVTTTEFDDNPSLALRVSLPMGAWIAVSYTHLTLPTNREV